MKRSFNIVLFTICLSVLCINELKAQVNEFSAKVNGDIYNQVHVIDDVDSDGNKDMIFAATDGKIHIFSSKGKEIIRPPYWPKQVDAPITGGIEVTDLDGKGHINILATTMGGTTYCLNSKGKELWKTKSVGKVNWTSPKVADFGKTGKKNIIVSTEAGYVNVFDSSGTLLHTVKMNNPVTGDPFVSDLGSGDDKYLIVKDSMGKVVFIDEGGAVVKQLQTESSNNFNISDTNGDGIPEILTTIAKTDGSGEFKMWDLDGKLLSNLPLTTDSVPAPQVADIDGDGTDDIIITQSDGKVMVCDKDGKVKEGWPYVNDEAYIHSKPTIIDLDGDGSPEIVYSSIMDGGDGLEAGCVIALDKNGQPVKGFPRYVGKIYAPLTFADLDGDGSMEIIAAGGVGLTGPQLNVIRTDTRPKFKMVTLRQTTTIKK